ncbi:MAG: TTAGGG repeat binding factor [Thelocarpon superellum]|nr:MAG: TTAGGG repeat binding factor [Thelocarpon superellum]
MNGSTSPQKRRRTRSSALTEESPLKRPNRNPETDYHQAIAAAAQLQVAAEEAEGSGQQEPGSGQESGQDPGREQRASPLPDPGREGEPEHGQEQDLDPAAPPPEPEPHEPPVDHGVDTPTASVPVVNGRAQESIMLDYSYAMHNWNDPTLHLRVQSLPILENLSIQTLETLAKPSYQETLNIVTEPTSPQGQAYAALKALFDQTKKLYSPHEPFISAHDLDYHAPEHRGIIRKANLATFVSSVFGSQDVGFYHLNEYFLETFVPEGGRLLKSQGGLFLDLKTQAYLSAMANGERSRDEILEDLFPDSLGERLMSRRPHAKQMTPSEVDFVKRARSRRDHLRSEPDDEASLAALPDKYVWEDFLRDVSGYVSRNFHDLVSGATTKVGKTRLSGYAMGEVSVQPGQPQAAEEAAVSQMDPDDAHFHEVLRAHNQHYTHQEMQQAARQEAMEKAARAAQVALQHEMMHPHKVEDLRVDHAPTPPVEATEPSQADGGEMTQAPVSTGDIPYHTQSAPTQVLYERARLAATAKASPNNRRAGLPSQRRPWTTEEENALMAGLDRVKGPHWSQILAMFGAGGNINESLKDRNQVQLKDKARNLKLFFLKSGIEVPYYLQFVTGELKTRAPSQAAKHEAKERAKVLGDEDRAHVEGVLALAGGPLQPNAADGSADEANGEATTDEATLEQHMVEQLQAAVQEEERKPHHVTSPQPAESPPDSRARRSTRIPAQAAAG